MKKLKQITTQKLKDKGIEIDELATLVYEIQIDYCSNLTKKECKTAINEILSKREVIHTILTGLILDEYADKHPDETINQIIKNDQGTYGTDETLALGILNLYGTIAYTNFGYLDKTKPGIIGIIDKKGKNKEYCTTFLDDIIAAIVAAAASKIAHIKKTPQKQCFKTKQI